MWYRAGEDAGEGVDLTQFGQDSHMGLAVVVHTVKKEFGCRRGGLSDLGWSVDICTIC